MAEKTITITLPVGDLGAASIALDRFVADEPRLDESFKSAQERFDKIYKAYWELERLGVQL